MVKLRRPTTLVPRQVAGLVHVLLGWVSCPRSLTRRQDCQVLGRQSTSHARPFSFQLSASTSQSMAPLALS